MVHSPDCGSDIYGDNDHVDGDDDNDDEDDNEDDEVAVITRNDDTRIADVMHELLR